VQNIQPLVTEYSGGVVAVGHNGNLTNARVLRRYYESRGSIFQTSTDSEVFMHLLATRATSVRSIPCARRSRACGAYALVLLRRTS